MALNKANTSFGVKAVLILLIIVFVASFIAVGTSGLGGGGQTNTNTGTGNDSLASIDAQYGPTVQSLTTQLQSDPTSYTALVALGNTYFDWAAQTQQASQNNTSTVGSDLPLWNSAKDAYSRAVAVKSGEPPVMVDYAIATFYTGDTAGAVELAEKVTKSDPEFAPAWFNLGIFYSATQRNDDAVASFEKYLELDPQGTQGGNPDFAKQQIEQLKGGTTNP